MHLLCMGSVVWTLLQAIMAYDQFGKDTEMIVQDSSSFAEEGERISFLQVQVVRHPCLHSNWVSTEAVPRLWSSSHLPVNEA